LKVVVLYGVPVYVPAGSVFQVVDESIGPAKPHSDVGCGAQVHP
jgi:hypothetical protein